MPVSVVPDKMDHMTSELVGRDAELEQLCSTLGISASADRPASAADAERSAVLLAGDAGVGKTRLLTELRDRAVARGWLVQAGHCLDFADSALPFLPFSEITGRIARELPDLFDEVTERHPALLRLLPGQRMLSQATDPESVMLPYESGAGVGPNATTSWWSTHPISVASTTRVSGSSRTRSSTHPSSVSEAP